LAAYRRFTTKVAAMHDIEVFSSPSRRNATEGLRRTFGYLQNTLYHVNNAFDATDEGILEQGEWETWKGLLREAHSHPLLLTVIWHGYQNRYYSREFAAFLQQELILSLTASGQSPDYTGQPRDREFLAQYYPAMTDKDWPLSLPCYAARNKCNADLPERTGWVEGQGFIYIPFLYSPPTESKKQQDAEKVVARIFAVLKNPHAEIRDTAGKGFYALANSNCILSMASRKVFQHPVDLTTATRKR
jgi:hypothetical protein